MENMTLSFSGEKSKVNILGAGRSNLCKPFERNIILIGLPGSGKTTIGKRAAEVLGREFYDSDAEIEAREGKTCAEIINGEGEQKFRAIEQEVIKELTGKKGTVIAMGGGAPVHSGEYLVKDSVVAYIQRKPEEIVKSFAENPGLRPLSQTAEDLERLMIQRQQHYFGRLNVLIHNHFDVETAVNQLLEKVKPHLKARLLVINGPNLNMLGVREPEIYGSASYEDLTKLIQETCYNERGIAVACYHSNHEGNIIDTIQDTLGRYDGIVINPGAYTHYSYAIHDALKGIPVPAIEVHISDTSRREEFRRISVTAPACIAQIAGKGFGGYIDAIDILLKELDL